MVIRSRTLRFGDPYQHVLITVIIGVQVVLVAEGVPV